MTWKPNTTVAAIVEQNGRFLMVEENTPDGLRINQPAGHLEQGESLLEAAKREANEETAYVFEPEALLGVYQWQHPTREITYMRFAFIGQASHHNLEQALDDGILRAVWMTAEELRACQAMHRSPQVMLCVEDYLAGKRYPLDVIHHII